jgi:hypothetical protein
MSGSTLDLAPSTALIYRGEWRAKPERAIYLLDQAFAKAAIDYFAEATDFSYHPTFAVYVRSRDADRARITIEKIQRKNV